MRPVGKTPEPLGLSNTTARRGEHMMWQERFSEFVTLLLVINPLEVVLSFIGLSSALGARQQRLLALKAVLVAFVVLAFFMLLGGAVLHHLHVPVRALQISGGIVLFLVAIDMIHGHKLPTDTDAPAGLSALAVYPLGFPKIAGPAVILTAILMADDGRFDFTERLRTVVVLAVALAVLLGMLFAAAPISRLVGVTGAQVVSRLMGMLLAALATTLILTAVVDWLRLPTL